MAKRKELRRMLIKMLDMVQTIKMYASEPIKPSNIRVFDIKPEIWDWLCQHETELEELLYGWKRKMHPDLRTPLPEGQTHEPAQVSPDPAHADADGVR